MQLHSYRKKLWGGILLNCKQIRDAHLIYLLVTMTVLLFFRSGGNGTALDGPARQLPFLKCCHP